MSFQWGIKYASMYYLDECHASQCEGNTHLLTVVVVGCAQDTLAERLWYAWIIMERTHTRYICDMLLAYAGRYSRADSDEGTTSSRR
jgi:hypothetical protein